MKKMDDLFEDQCIQDIGHTFMTHHGITDKDISEEINKNLPRLVATQFPVSRNTLVHQNYKLDMKSKNGFQPFSSEREEEIQRFHDSLVHNQLTRNLFSHAWKQTYLQINDFCNTFYIPYKSRDTF